MQSIGERLEEARKRKGISIREAAEATKIRGDYLHKFESNQFDIKLPEIYVRGFIRTYANYLKIPADKIVSDYNGLGLGDARNSRAINREVYGRMDLSVASAKAEKETKEPAPAAESIEAIEPPAPRNPATFVPKSTGGGNSISIDQGLLIKIAAAAVGLIVLLILIFAFMGRGSKSSSSGSSSSASSVSTAPTETWVRAQGNESSLTLVALDRVQINVQTDTGRVLYQGTLNRGERRTIPYTMKLQVNTDVPENLRINIAGQEFPLIDPKGPPGTYLKSAVIGAPK
jgi:transcriptional regulator with XRE-family HTH domain